MKLRSKRRVPNHVAGVPAASSKFGLLAYRETNLGDDIQAFAALQFMPRVDYFVHRDSIGAFATATPTRKLRLS
jgi:hypothetical protein